ncbi:MAG: leucine-rich repeat protein [Clostridia bacterium]|nr:leucine-rich repeat protein [Clostridia bacterium]
MSNLSLKRIAAVLLSFLIIFSQTVVFSDTVIEETEISNSIYNEKADSENDELYEGFLDKLFYGEEVSFFGTLAGEKLSEIPKALYDVLKKDIEGVCYTETENEVLSTAFEVDLNKLTEKGAILSFEAESVNEAFALFTAQMETENVVEALLHDLPLELFWYDKVTGLKQSASFSRSGNLYTITKYSFKFAVAENYQPADYDASAPTLNVGYIKDALAASKKTKEIIEKYSSLEDYDKLLAYKNEICALTSYDYSAASSGNFSFDNSPWQLINVFDGDESTKVVCEGYSKAFLYLCDMSDFSCDVKCYAAIGALSGGNHMWNIVNIKGRNYIADVTNSDSYGDNRVFIAAASGDISAYTLAGSTYTYSDDTFALWGTDEKSPLHISAESYVVDGESHSYVDGVCVICEAVGGKCGENINWYIKDGILYITGSGAMDDYTEKTVPWYDYLNEITEVRVSEGVEVIGANSFRGLVNVKEIILPESITTISDVAFWGSGIEKIIFPKNVSSIGKYALYNCENLTEIIFEGSAPAINEKAFMSLEAAAYYVVTDESWDDTKKLDYGGNITWIGETYCDMHGHSEAADSGYEPNCTEDGLTDGSHCEICGEVLIKQEVIEKLGHDMGEYCETVAPTCTENGEKQRDCSRCDYFETEVINYLGHSIVVDEMVEPTCTEPGISEGSHCSRCGEVMEVQVIIEAKGHNYFTVVTEPDCLNGGFTTYTCLDCGHSYVSDYTDAKGHKETVDSAKAPTCTQEGLTEGSHCETCGLVLTKQEIIPATGHTEKIVEGYDSTCDKEGKTDGVICSVCGKVLTAQSIISAKGHNYTSVVKEPTCTADGYTTYTCTVCEDSYKSDYVTSKGHDFETTVTAPTCEKEGYTTYRCKTCGYAVEKADIVPALGHNYETEVVLPTCESGGYTVYTCINCLASHKADFTSAKGHSFKGTVTPPTCADRGFTTYKCEYCDYSYKLNYTDPTGNHTYSNSADTSCNVCGYVRVIKTTPMYRMYNPNSGEHFYTGSTEERDILVNAGWHYEGVAFNFPVVGKPVYRLYEPKTGEHLYTMDEAEKAKLLSEDWNYEGVAFNSAGEDEVAQYRLHNPNATCGAYHFTGSKEERDILIAAGWEYQGIGWYSCLR